MIDLIDFHQTDQAAFNSFGFVGAEDRNTETGALEALGPQIVSPEYFEKLFVWNDWRRNQFLKLLDWLDEIRRNDIKTMCIWFGGSFTEKKDEPADIDLLLFYTTIGVVMPQPPYLNRKVCEERYGIDLRSMNVNQNPVNVVHQVVQYVLYFSHPTSTKAGAHEPFHRRAIISVPGDGVAKWQDG